MVIHESFVTRKPLEFTLIVLVIIFLLLLPVYFYTKQKAEQAVVEAELILETYEEVAFLFSPESDLSESDKKHLFRLKYEGNLVQWQGTMLSCDAMTGLFRVRVDETGNGFADLLFTTLQDCTGIPPGSVIFFKMKLIDWKVTTFIGSEGEILK